MCLEAEIISKVVKQSDHDGLIVVAVPQHCGSSLQTVALNVDLIAEGRLVLQRLKHGQHLSRAAFSQINVALAREQLLFFACDRLQIASLDVDHSRIEQGTALPKLMGDIVAIHGILI